MNLKEIKPGMAIKCNSFEEALFLYGWFYQNGYVRKEEEPDLFENYIDCWRTAPYGIEINPRTWTTMDGAKEITPFSSLILPEKTYEDGLNDAWRVLKHVQSGELSEKEIKEVWGMTCLDFVNCFAEKYTPQEAISKLEAYESQEKIKIGDVVVGSIFKGIITAICNGRAFIMYDDGSSKEISLDKCKKTGKNIDISSILAEIGKE